MVVVVGVGVVYHSIYLSNYICLSASLKTRLLHFLNLTTSEAQQVCQTSSIFELPHFSKLTTSETKQFWKTSFKNGKLSAELTASYQFVLRFFHSICLKRCACHEKVTPGHTKCCTCQAKSSQLDAPKCSPLRKSAP